MSQNKQQKSRTSSKQSFSGASGVRSGDAGSQAVSSDLLRNVPPHSVEAEQAVLGGVFLKPESLYSVIDILTEEDFYIPANQLIFGAFRGLFTKNAPVDLVSVAEQLKSQSQLEEAGGAVYLAELARSIVSAANAEYYAGIVRDKAMARGLIHSCVDIIAKSYDPGQDVESLINDSEQSIFSISQRNSGRTYKDSGELTKKLFDDLAIRLNNREMSSGVRTGFTQLDKMTAGFQPSDLIILAARPSMGKTAFALNIVMRAAIQYQTPAVVYSLEMSMDQLISRMLCAWAKVDVSKLRGVNLNDDEWFALHEAAKAFQTAPIYIDDTPSLSPIELRARTRRLKKEKGIGLVVIDYLQLMRSARKTDSRELEISDISRNLKAMAKELNVPVIALSQLNRKVEERADKRPLLSDLRESGAIEQDADIIMFIYRQAAYEKPADRPPVDQAEIIIGKHRNGPVGSVPLMYASAYTAFENLAPEYGPATDF